MNLQLDEKPYCLLLTGTSGTGKTTFGIIYLVSDLTLAVRFIFDPEGEYQLRLGLTAAQTEEELICAAEEGFCIFDPHAMFPGNIQGAFEYFCQFAFDMASSMPGRKILLADEAWKYCTPQTIPTPLALCIQTGRKRGLFTMFATQRPNKMNEAILNEATELICFGLSGKNALDEMENLGAPREEISMLPDGQYIAINVKSGGILRGNIFQRKKNSTAKTGQKRA